MITHINDKLILALKQIQTTGLNLPLVPIGGNKQPLGDGWQNRPFTPSQLIEAIKTGRVEVSLQGAIKKIPLHGFGIITGLPVVIDGMTYYLMALDQDGASAIELIQKFSNGKGVPDTVAFSSGRPGRCQYLFLVPELYKDLIRTQKIKTGVIGDDGKPEQLEFRWASLQSVLPPSVHPMTGHYHWIEGKALGEIKIEIISPWILLQMLINPNSLEAKILQVLHDYDIPLKLNKEGKELHGEVLAAINEKVDIVELVQQYVPLLKQGKNYLSRCPFHNGKVKSFTVSREKQHFSCYECGTSGQVVNFLYLLGNNSLEDLILVPNLPQGVGNKQPNLINNQPENTTQETINNNQATGNNHLRTGTNSKAIRHWTAQDWALSYLQALSTFRADDYDDWLTVGMALHSVDDSLLLDWDNWSRQSSKYKPGDCEKKWKSFKPNGGVTLGTLAHLAKQDGWRSPFESKKDKYRSTSPTKPNSVNPNSKQNEPSVSTKTDPNTSSKQNEPSVSTNNTPQNNPKNMNLPEGTSTRSERSLQECIEQILDQNLDDAAQDLALVELAKNYDNYNASEIRAIAKKFIDQRHQQDYLLERKKELEALEYREKLEYQPFDDLFYDCPQIAKAFQYLCQVNQKIQPQYFLGLLSTFSSCMGIKGEVEAPVLGTVKGTLNIGLVGESGEGKSIVSKILVRPLYTIQEELRRKYATQKQEYEQALENWNRQHPDHRGPKPSQSEYITATDAFLVISEYSREGIVRNHVDNPNGLLIYQEEMVALQRAQNMYRQGKGDDRQFLNNLYDNGPISRALKTERLEIKESAVSMFGGYQPAVIFAEMGDMEDPDGQWARLNFVYGIEKKVYTRFDQPIVKVDDILLPLYRKALFAPRLLNHFDAAGLKLLENFTNEMEDARWRCLQGGMRAVYSKASSEVMRIALDLHWLNCLLTGDTVSEIIPVRAVEHAIKIKKFLISQVDVIRTWGNGSPRTEEGLAPIYRAFQKLGARLEGVEDILTTRMVLSARIPLLKGLSAKQVEKLFQDMAAMGKAVIVNVKRGIGLLISSLLGKDSPPDNRPGGGSPFIPSDPPSSDDDWLTEPTEKRPEAYRGAAAVVNSPSMVNNPSVITTSEVVNSPSVVNSSAVVNNPSMVNSPSVIIPSLLVSSFSPVVNPFSFGFAETAEKVLNNSQRMKPSSDKEFGHFAEIAETAGRYFDFLSQEDNNLPAQTANSAKPVGLTLVPTTQAELEKTNLMDSQSHQSHKNASATPIELTSVPATEAELEKINLMDSQPNQNHKPNSASPVELTSKNLIEATFEKYGGDNPTTDSRSSEVIEWLLQFLFDLEFPHQSQTRFSSYESLEKQGLECEKHIDEHYEELVVVCPDYLERYWNAYCEIIDLVDRHQFHLAKARYFMVCVYADLILMVKIQRQDVSEAVDAEIERLGWSVEQCSQYIQGKYNVTSHLLTDEQLLEFLYFLAEQEPIAVDGQPIYIYQGNPTGFNAGGLVDVPNKKQKLEQQYQTLKSGERVIVLEDEPLSEVMQKNNLCLCRSLDAAWQGMIAVVRSHLRRLEPPMQLEGC